MKRFLVMVLLVTACGPSGQKANDATGGGDTTSTADADPFGTECTTSDQCPNGGYCINGYGGKVCTYECTEGCPAGWQCRATKVDGNLISVCVPPDFQLCTSCSADNQCSDGACTVLGTENYCLPHCPFEGQCPSGYTCSPDPAGTHPGMYCVPNSGSCSCTDAQDGTVRTCTNTNAFGTCKGLETCRPKQGGWVGCDAPSASAEVCDGMDNDCNMLIDDGVASGQPCQITNSNGSCPGVTLCTGASGSICQGNTPAAETCNYIDDNCNGTIDELWPTVNTVCSAGVGACQRFGVIRCDALGTGTQCSAMAGSPMAELCNGNDDNCNGMIDETFPTKGNLCTVGTGACQRTGNLVCNSSGSALQCSVMPGTGTAETCNGVDDNCNGQIDETFKDANGNYALDTACGSCAINCTTQYGLPNASGHCNTTGSPICQMICNMGSFDLDAVVANGCEFTLDPGAIYVSTNDAAAADDAGCGLGPVNTGPGYHPCKTIAQGIARANGLNRPRVLVANGYYNEAVTLSNGRSLLGAYRPDNWVRDLSSTATLIAGVSSSGNHDRTVVAVNITSPTVFEGFAVLGSVNGKPSGNSYAIYVNGSNSNLTIRSNVIFSGRGGPGGKGSDGVDGGVGADGAGRNPDPNMADATYDSKQALSGTGECDVVNNRQFLNGGATTCGGTSTAGGRGGGNQCPALSKCTTGTSTGCSAASWMENTAIDGLAGNAGGGGGGGAGGTGGYAGDDMFIYNSSSGIYCYLPPSDADPDPDNPFGLDGGNGGNGLNGAAGMGCSATTGSVDMFGNWVGGMAGGGVNGGNGGGGGGGGAGGGGTCNPTSPAGGSPTGCTGGSGTTAYLNGKDKLGPHGGGGGAGGCGGLGGGGATAGGGAFGIFIVGTAAPVITSNTIYRGEGGIGGPGGAGGKGGVGGSGAAGGLDGGIFCTDVAGRGGNGGNGGHGAGGGGGCGGSSFGIYTSGLGTPNYCMSAAMNAFSGGSGGNGGAGGYSIINQGSQGSAGTLQDCSFN